MCTCPYLIPTHLAQPRTHLAPRQSFAGGSAPSLPPSLPCPPRRRLRMRCLEWRLCAPARGIKLSAPPSSPSPPPSPPSATPPLSLENVVLKRTLPPDASTPHTIVRTLFRLRDPELTVVQGKLGAARSELLAAWNSLKALRASTSVKVRGPPQTTDAHVAQRISEGIAAAESEANSRLKGERTIRHAAEKSCATAEAQLDKLRASTAAAARAAMQLQVVAMRKQVLTASLSRDAAIARVEAARETVRELGARHQETCGHLAGVRAANKAGEARESSLEGKLTAAEQEIARLKQELSDAQRKASRAGIALRGRARFGKMIVLSCRLSWSTVKQTWRWPNSSWRRWTSVCRNGRPVRCTLEDGLGVMMGATSSRRAGRACRRAPTSWLCGGTPTTSCTG